MVREARKKSSIGIYHVMLRGLDKRYIFLEDSDKEKNVKGRTNETSPCHY